MPSQRARSLDMTSLKKFGYIHIASTDLSVCCATCHDPIKSDSCVPMFDVVMKHLEVKHPGVISQLLQWLYPLDKRGQALKQLFKQNQDTNLNYSIPEPSREPIQVETIKHEPEAEAEKIPRKHSSKSNKHHKKKKRKVSPPVSPDSNEPTSSVDTVSLAQNNLDEPVESVELDPTMIKIIEFILHHDLPYQTVEHPTFRALLPNHIGSLTSFDLQLSIVRLATYIRSRLVSQWSINSFQSVNQSSPISHFITVSLQLVVDRSAPRVNILLHARSDQPTATSLLSKQPANSGLFASVPIKSSDFMALTRPLIELKRTGINIAALVSDISMGSQSHQTVNQSSSTSNIQTNEVKTIELLANLAGTVTLPPVFSSYRQTMKRILVSLLSHPTLAVIVNPFLQLTEATMLQQYSQSGVSSVPAMLRKISRMRDLVQANGASNDGLVTALKANISDQQWNVLHELLPVLEAIGETLETANNTLYDLCHGFNRLVFALHQLDLRASMVSKDSSSQEHFFADPSLNAFQWLPIVGPHIDQWLTEHTDQSVLLMTLNWLGGGFGIDSGWRFSQPSQDDNTVELPASFKQSRTRLILSFLSNLMQKFGIVKQSELDSFRLQVFNFDSMKGAFARHPEEVAELAGTKKIDMIQYWSRRKSEPTTKLLARIALSLMLIAVDLDHVSISTRARDLSDDELSNEIVILANPSLLN